MRWQTGCSVVVSVGLSLLAATEAVAREVVLPVVTKRVTGAQGSVWETRVQVLRVSTDQDVVVRRAWVALPGGGFVDDPATAPTWVLEVEGGGTYDTHSALVLTGEDLLAGVEASQGAVGLEVTGEALVQGRIADAGDGSGQPTGTWPGVTAGAGQLVPAPVAPLQGRAVLPSGGQVMECRPVLPGAFRSNVGLVNPGTAALGVEIRGIAYSSHEQEPVFMAAGLPQLVPLQVTLAPLEWVQVNDIVPELRFVEPNIWGARPCDLGVFFAFNLAPDDDAAPYYAYVSVVYSDRNDPEFIPAVPGQLPEGPEGWFPRE